MRELVPVALLLVVAAVGPTASRAVALPPFLAYLLGPGAHWLLVLAAVAATLSLARRSAWLPRVATPWRDRLEARPALGWALLAALVVLAFVRVPDLRRELANIGGDEPKYLRIALSLVNDTDVDVSGGRETPPDLALRLKQVWSLALAARDAAVGLVRPAPIPAEHRWDAGNWAVHGRHGGVYHLQPPGLPALVAVFVGVGQALFPERLPGYFAALFLVCCWILGAVETYRLARELLASRAAAALTTTLLFATAPVFVGGYHLYPESVALFLVPFAYRLLRASERPLGSGAALAAGFVAGALWWVHPKFVALGLVLVTLGLLRPGARVRARALVAAAFVAAAGSSLAYVHYLTGLLRPEGLYIRQAQEYVGVPPLASSAYVHGLANGLVGAKDGIFVLAPVLLLGVAALPAAFAARRRTSLELVALFAAVWLTAAVHGGVSLGSPARLFVPVAFAPALALAIAVRALGPRPRVLVPLLLLSLVSLAVTARTTSHWRLALNPYRGLFASAAHDFTRSLPARERPTASPAADATQALLLLGTALALGLRWRRRRSPDTAPPLEALWLLAAAVALAYGLDAASSWLPSGDS